MSLIIKGMEMPKSNTMFTVTLRVRQDGTAEFVSTSGKTVKSFPMIEVPTPHGRLIDEEAIYNNVKSRCNNCHIRACAICGVTCILNDIRTAPTIIEAEVSENA